MRTARVMLIVTMTCFAPSHVFGGGIQGLSFQMPRLEMGETSDMVTDVIRHLDSVRAGDAERGHVQFALGAMHWLLDHFDQAQQEWEACAVSGVAQADCSFHLGSFVLRRPGKHQEHQDKSRFIHVMEQTIALDPQYVRAYNNLADFYEHEQEFDKANAIWNLAKQRMPDEETFYYNQASMQWREWGRSKPQRDELLPEIIANLTKATALQPRSLSYFVLGMSYLFSTQYLEARAALQRAHDLDLNDFNTLIALAMAYKATKQFPQAMATLEEALALQPTREDIQADMKELREHMESIGKSK